jgi:DNA-binding NarL/FixJ family response regulator
MISSTVMIVDDDRLMADLLTTRLGQEPGLRVVGRAGGVEEALPMAASTRPDLILLDVELPGVDGPSMVAALRRKAPGVRIIILSSHHDAYTIYRVTRSNVQGYVEKPNPIDVVVEAVHHVLRGGVFFSPTFLEMKRKLLEAPGAFHRVLSEREQEVMRWVVAGMSDTKISAKHGISVQTVAVHRRNIRRKLTLHSDREMVAYARRWGIRVMAGPSKKSMAAPRSAKRRVRGRVK